MRFDNRYSHGYVYGTLSRHEKLVITTVPGLVASSVIENEIKRRITAKSHGLSTQQNIIGQLPAGP